MRIAVCFSGMIRTGINAHKSINNFLETHRGQFTFFLHTWKFQHERACRINVNHPKTLDPVPNLMSHSEVDFLTKTFNFSSIKIDRYDQVASNQSKIQPHMISWYQSILLKQQYEITNNMRFDYVVKLRPDVIFRTGNTLIDILDNLGTTDFGINHFHYDDSSHIYEVDDVFYVSSSNAMDIAAQFVPESITQPCPSKRMYKYLTDHGLTPVNLNYNYWDQSPKHTILREHCVVYDPKSQFDLCAECNMRLHFPQNLVTNHMSEDQINRLNKLAGYDKGDLS